MEPVHFKVRDFYRHSIWSGTAVTLHGVIALLDFIIDHDLSKEEIIKVRNKIVRNA